MDFMVNIDIRKPARPITYRDKILLIGSCFTEHIGNTLEELKFSILQNPNGILFDPVSVCNSLISYTENKQYKEEDLFELNEVWHSWQHHSRFSQTGQQGGLRRINESQEKAHHFLKETDWVIITLGSAFSYRLTSSALSSLSPGPWKEGAGVANCHRAPAQWFDKHLLAIDEIITHLDECYHRLMQFNHGLRILFTVSPVRHIRDGVVENNRSKARLIEAVHHLVNKFDRLHYFPAYELVIDVLRDYRFYDVDLVHPNYMATEFVLQKFAESCIDNEARQLMQEIRKIVIARKHKAFQPDTQVHRQFLAAHFDKTQVLQAKYPFLDFSEELAYFRQ